MRNTKIILLVLVMVVLTSLFIGAYTAFGTGTSTVYGDEYARRYFQRDKVMEINIEISEADWQYILNNAAAEEFRPATITIDGDVYPSINIRAKGNSSLMSVARSESDRYSFKINFQQKKRDNRTAAGLTQLNLNNCFSDPSYMREYLSYQIFEEMGVAVPAFAYAAVHVNGEYFGLYLAVESILEPYLERNFGNFTGDLYKSVGHPLTFDGENPADYAGLEVKSTLKNANWSRLTRMLDVLNNGGDIERYIDVDAALRYIAVSTALANFDSYQGSFAHNYYLYEHNGVFTILPWDLNMSFGGFDFGGDEANVYIDEPTQGALASRPLVARLLENESYRETYHGYLEEIATRYLSGGYLAAETERLFELIAPYVASDPTAFYTYEQFAESISGTIIGGAMSEENEAVIVPERQETGGLSGREGFRMGGARGFGGSVPGILELAAAMSETILKQLGGAMPSGNNGMGSGRGAGAWPGGAPGFEGENPGQQRPGGNAPPRGGGGGLVPDLEGVDMAALETIVREIREAGGLTEELREKAAELGLPDQMLEILAANQGVFEPGGRGGMFPGRQDGIAPGARLEERDIRGFIPGGIDARQNPAVDRRTVTTLLISGSVITAGIIAALLFKRRRYARA